MEGYLNFKEACKAIGVKKSSMYNLINAGKFSAKGDTIVHMRKRWFKKSTMEKYIENIIELNS